MGYDKVKQKVSILQENVLSRVPDTSNSATNFFPLSFDYYYIYMHIHIHEYIIAESS